MNLVEQCYDTMPEYEWRRLERHRVEYGVTMKALVEHLPPAPAKVADIGGSVGRYSIELARRGYEVTLVDISNKCLEFARSKAAEAGVRLATIVHGDARHLPMLQDGGFDAVLLMGPLYHLLEHGQRLRAVREAYRLLRPGGAVFAVFVTRNSIVQYAAATDVQFVAQHREALESVLATGTCSSPWDSKSASPSCFYFCQAEEVTPLMVEGGFQKVSLTNVEALVYELETAINAAPEDLHRQWIDLVYRLGQDPTVLGTGGHLLYVGRKV